MQIGRIYKIISLKDDEMCYIGSTIYNLGTRFRGHRKTSRNKRKRPSSAQMFDKYPIDSLRIQLIECIRYAPENNNVLLQREQYHMNNCDNKCNKNKAINGDLPEHYDCEIYNYELIPDSLPKHWHPQIVIAKTHP